MNFPFHPPTLDTRADVLSACVTATCPRDFLIAVHTTVVDTSRGDGERTHVTLFNGRLTVTQLRDSLAVVCGARDELASVMRRARIFVRNRALPLPVDEPWAALHSVWREATCATGMLATAYTPMGTPRAALRWYHGVRPSACAPLCTRNMAAVAVDRRTTTPANTADAFADGVLWIMHAQRLGCGGAARSLEFVPPCTWPAPCGCFLDFCMARALGGRLDLRVVLAPNDSDARAMLRAAEAAVTTPVVVPRALYSCFAPEGGEHSDDDDGDDTGSSSASRSEVGSAAHARYVLRSGDGTTCFELALARYAPHSGALYELCASATVDEYHAACLRTMLAEEGRVRLCERVLRHARVLPKVMGGDRGARALAVYTAGNAAALVSYGMAALAHARPTPLTRATCVLSGYHVAALLALAHSVAHLRAGPREGNTWDDLCRFTLPFGSQPPPPSAPARAPLPP